MLDQIINDGNDIDKYIKKAKDKNDPFRLMGFGHRVYKNYDPRAKVMQKTCHELLDHLGLKNDPKLAIAMELEKVALNDEYFKRIEAINYTLEHDDGQNTDTISGAEIILVGVSRTSKTPTCIYLANQGIKAANIPLVPEQELPNFLTTSNDMLIVALITTPQNLVEVRKKRAIELGLDPKKDDYTNINTVTKEIDDAKRIFNKMGWPTIDTTRRSVEETAAAIMNIRAQK